tara:strand:+ start:106 stop:813 length:708 start_codon:yes stop_codon:yes gene_type:complete
VKSKKKVLILGASSDIGICVINEFLENDFCVMAHFHKNSKPLMNFKKNKYFSSFSLDLSREVNNSQIKKISKNYDIFINLTGLINNVSFQNFNYKNLNKILLANYINPLLILRHIFPGMIKKKWGRILMSSSIGVKFGGSKNTFAYSISKHLNEFIPSYFKDFYKNEIFYNTLRIGTTNTKIHKKIKNKNLSKRIKLIPIKKMANPEDIASYILFICSQKNKFITGSVLTIAGGE